MRLAEKVLTMKNHVVVFAEKPKIMFDFLTLMNFTVLLIEVACFGNKNRRRLC